LRIAADDDELLALLRASLLDDHLEPLMAQVRGRVHLGRHALLGSVASGIAHALSRSAGVLAGPTLEVAHQVLGALDLDHLVDLAPAPVGLTVHRRTCCLAFTLPTPKVCTDCCIR
jgi:ferric iron reductase protein FhuF